MAPDAEPLNLDPLIPRGSYPRTVLVAAEDRFANFRGSQITLTLDNRNNRFSEGEYKLAGGEEIAIVNGSQILWSGTVDPEYIEHNPDSSDLRIRVLQHGSLLNTINAGLPDWSLDENGELALNPDSYDRYKGTADNWKTKYNPDGTFGHNEIEDEDAVIYFTPSAIAQITDELYRAKFQTKVRHFHTAGRNVGDVEWPFPNIAHDGQTVWTGQFRQHYHPDFNLDPDDWDNTQAALLNPYGAYLRNSEPVRQLRRQSIQSLLAELVRQFNRTAKFPLQFDPDTDCTIIPPAISAAIEILKRQPGVEFIDCQNYTDTNEIPRVLFAVNYKTPDSDPNFRYSVFYLDNETELLPIVEFIPAPKRLTTVWPTHKNGVRFRRTNYTFTRATFAVVYTMNWNVFVIPGTVNSYALRFEAHWTPVNLISLEPRGIGRTAFVNEELGEFIDTPLPPAYVVNRYGQLTSGGVSTLTVRTGGEPNPPEHDPRMTLNTQNRVYSSRDGGITVSGALFDRVAVDAENVKLSTLISELAKLTHSRWFVTPDRRLKFISRQHPGPAVNIKPHRTFSLHTFSKKLDEQDIPEIGSSLIVPENFRQAHKNWIRDNVVNNSTSGLKTEVPLEDLDSFPAIGDAVRLADPAVPQIPAAELKTKYNNSFLLDSAAIDIDNETVAIEASLPTI